MTMKPRQKLVHFWTPVVITLVTFTNQAFAEIAIMHYGHFGGLSITCNRDELILMESELLGFSTNSDCNPQPLCSVPYTLAKWYCRGKSTCAGMQVERRPLHKRTCGNDFTNCLRVEYKCVSMRKMTDVCSDTIYEAPSGYISSPSFPEMYPPDKNCTCSLTAAHEEHVRVYSAFFLLKSSTPCNDWVSLTVDSEVTTKCGYIPEQKVHVGRNVNINFRSDQTDTEMGFWFKFSGTQGSPVTVRCGRYASMDSKVSPKRASPTTEITTTPTPTTTTIITTSTTVAPTTVATTLETLPATPITYLREQSKLDTGEEDYLQSSQDEIKVGDVFREDNTSPALKEWLGTTLSSSKSTSFSQPEYDSEQQVLEQDGRQGVFANRKPSHFQDQRDDKGTERYRLNSDHYQKTQLGGEDQGGQSILYVDPTPHPHHTRQPRSTAEPAQQTYGSIHEDGQVKSYNNKYNTLGIENGDQDLKVHTLPTSLSEIEVLDNTVHHVHTMKSSEKDSNAILPTSPPDENLRQAPLNEKVTYKPKEQFHDEQNQQNKEIPQTPSKDEQQTLITETKDYDAYSDYDYRNFKNKHVIGDYRNYEQEKNPPESPQTFSEVVKNKEPHQKRFEDVVLKVKEIRETLERIKNKDQRQDNSDAFRGGALGKTEKDTFISESYSSEIAENHLKQDQLQGQPTKVDQGQFKRNENYEQSGNEAFKETPNQKDYFHKEVNHQPKVMNNQRNPSFQPNTQSPSDNTMQSHNTMNLLPKLAPLTAKRPDEITFDQKYRPLPRVSNNQPVEIEYEKDFDSDPDDSLYNLEDNAVVAAENFIPARKYEQITDPPRTPVTPDYDLSHHVHSEAPWNRNSLATGEFKPAANHLALVDETTQPSTTVTTTNRPFRTAEVITLQGSIDENGLLLGAENVETLHSKNISNSLSEAFEFSNSELYGVIQTDNLQRKPDPTFPSSTTFTNKQFPKTTPLPKQQATPGNLVLTGIGNVTSMTTYYVTATDTKPGSEGPPNFLTSTIDTQSASKSTQKKSGTVWILLVIAVIGWIIFMAFLGLVIYYRRDRLPCRRSFTRMQNSPQTQKSTMPRQLVLPAFGGAMPFGLKASAPHNNASTQTKRKHAVPLFSSDGESSRSSTSLGSHLLSPSTASSPTPPHSNSPLQNRPLPPLPPTMRPPPPPIPMTPCGRNMGIQTIANSNICTQTEQSNGSQTDLTLMFNPFESISKAINRRSSYRDLESISKAIGRRSSFREIRSQPPTPVRDRYPPGQYAELPKKKPFATINASGLSALNNLNNSNISSWALHRIPSLCKDRRPRMLLRRSSSKQSKISNRSISPQVSFSLPGDLNHEGEIIDLSTPGFNRARTSSRTTSRTSSSCSAQVNPYASTSNIMHGMKMPHPHIPPNAHRFPHRGTPAHTPYPGKTRDPSPMSSNASEPRTPMHWRTPHPTPQLPPRHTQPSPLHHGRIHKLASPPLKPGPFRPPPPNPPQPKSPVEHSSVRSIDFPPPPPEIMLTDPPSHQSPPKKRLPIPYQQISTDFTLERASSTPSTPRSTAPAEKSSPPPTTPKSKSPDSTKTTYALPMKSAFGKVQEKAGTGYADNEQNDEDPPAENTEQQRATSYTDFYFSGDTGAPLIFNNDGRSSTSSRSSTAPELPPKHFTPVSSMRRAPPTPPPPPDVGTLTRPHKNNTLERNSSKSQKDNDGKSSPSKKDMDLQRIGPLHPDGNTSPGSEKSDNTMNTNDRRIRDTSTERMRKIVPQQANMFHDMVQPELQAILDKRRTKSEPVEV